MSVTSRGVKNAFRNTIRSISITAILALTIALALVMLLSLKAVQARIDDVKSNVGNTITVTPAANQLGTATITITVTDGDKTSTETFTVTVTAAEYEVFMPFIVR